MKKSLTFLLALLILASISPILAQSDSPEETQNETIEKDISDSILASQVTLPPVIKQFAKIIFGVEEDISLSKLILLLIAWFFILLTIANALSILPMFKGWMIYLVSALITILVSITGVLPSIIEFYFGMFLNIKFLSDSLVFAVMVSSIVLIALYFILSKVISIIRKSEIIGSSEIKGEEAGKGLAILRIFSKRY